MTAVEAVDAQDVSQKAGGVPRWLLLLGWAVSFALILWLLRRLWIEGAGIGVMDLSRRYVVEAVLWAMGAQVVRALGWVGYLRAMEASAPWSLSRVFFIAQISRWIPGRVWQVGSAAVFARNEGVPAATGGASVLVVLVMFQALGMALALGVLQQKIGPVLIVPIALIALVSCLFMPWMIRAASGFLLRLKPGLASSFAGLKRLPGMLGQLRLGLTLLGVWVGYGLSLRAAVLAVGGEGASLGVMEAIVLAAAALVVGFLAFLSPSGLGVREVVLVELLEQYGVGVETGVMVAVVYRVVLTAAEVLLFVGAGGSYLWTRRRGKRGVEGSKGVSGEGLTADHGGRERKL